MGSRGASGRDRGGRTATEDTVERGRCQWLEGMRRGGSIIYLFIYFYIQINPLGAAVAILRLDTSPHYRQYNSEYIRQMAPLMVPMYK